MAYDVSNLLEVQLLDPENGFLILKETLTRIGISVNEKKVLYQSCHILHKKGRYYVVHFKELFALDGSLVPIPSDDIGRRNTVAFLLQDWSLIKVIEPDKYTNRTPINLMRVLKYSTVVQEDWKLVPKYQIGFKHHGSRNADSTSSSTNF